MEFEHLDMPIKRHLITSWCVGCRYFNGVQSGNCSAYPNGIPERYADAYSGTMPDKHDSVQDDQVGEYTFINDAWSKVYQKEMEKKFLIDKERLIWLCVTIIQSQLYLFV